MMKDLTLNQQITNLKTLNRFQQVAAVKDVVSRGVIQLIQAHPFYGLLVARVDRQVNLKLTAAFGISWWHRKVALLVNPTRFVKQIQTTRDLFFALEHEALHLIWLHPVRYPRGNAMTQIGTDVAVNQYVPDRSSRALTLFKLNQKLGLQLPTGRDSSYYVTALRNYISRHSSTRSSDGRSGKKRHPKLALWMRFRRGDDHSGWQREADVSAAEKTFQLKRLIQGTLRQTNAKGRGSLPGNVRRQLWRLGPRRTLNWKNYIRLGMGTLQFGTLPSRARFNRRQAYRMDLPGRVSNTVQNVDVFVDNSGSMSDGEIQFLLAQLGGFLKQFPVNVNVYDFDTKVHAADHYVANHFNQIRFRRIGGGGTSFQSVFNYCHRRIDRFANHLIVILTDGQGERHLNSYHLTHVLWILTVPTKSFSVRYASGKVVTLVNDPEFVRRFGRR